MQINQMHSSLSVQKQIKYKVNWLKELTPIKDVIYYLCYKVKLQVYLVVVFELNLISKCVQMITVMRIWRENVLKCHENNVRKSQWS